MHLQLRAAQLADAVSDKYSQPLPSLLRISVQGEGLGLLTLPRHFQQSWQRMCSPGSPQSHGSTSNTFPKWQHFRKIHSYSCTVQDLPEAGNSPPQHPASDCTGPWFEGAHNQLPKPQHRKAMNQQVHTRTRHALLIELRTYAVRIVKGSSNFSN